MIRSVGCDNAAILPLESELETQRGRPSALVAFVPRMFCFDNSISELELLQSWWTRPSRSSSLAVYQPSSLGPLWPCGEHVLPELWNECCAAAGDILRKSCCEKQRRSGLYVFDILHSFSSRVAFAWVDCCGYDSPTYLLLISQELQRLGGLECLEMCGDYKRRGK